MRVINKDNALKLFNSRRSEAGSSGDRELVSGIIDAVRLDGDRAIREYTRRFDGVEPGGLLVERDRLAAAHQALDPALLKAVMRSISRVRAFYERQVEDGFQFTEGDSKLGMLVRPLERVACYVPGGTAPLFSSLIMTAVPAMVAGVKEIVVASPPAPDGLPASPILAVAHELGIETVYGMGGAQAVAGLAWGTETVRRVDKIVGPGNRFVVLAKQLVFGTVGIEALPGPTETLVLADDSADPGHVIADLLAQAEHAGAVPVLVTCSERVATAVVHGFEAALAALPDAATARESLASRGLLVRVDSVADGIEVANAFAPEHLCVLLDDPCSVLPSVLHAGGVFLGHQSMEALGDYMAGPSHVMPTGGSARFSSFLNLRDFQRVVPVIAVGSDLLGQIGPDAALLARAEGLEAHARAIEARLSGAARHPAEAAE
jgi:histidinol dehydrogenase